MRPPRSAGHENRAKPLAPDRELLTLLRAIEPCLAELSDEWEGRLVVHLAPSQEATRVEQLEFIPPAPRGTSTRLLRRLAAETLPGCAVPRPFEMHFECTSD